MSKTGNLAISVCWLVLGTPLIFAQDLSRYREFQLGMNLHAVAELVDARPSEVRVVHQRPAVIQELEWRPQRALASSSEANSVNEVLFSFYDGESFRMVVSYDPDRTQGLTDEDMIEGVSATYGIATKPAATIILFSSSHVYNDSEKVMARWETWAEPRRLPWTKTTRRLLKVPANRLTFKAASSSCAVKLKTPRRTRTVRSCRTGWPSW